MNVFPKGKKVILFDGVCNLCNNAVQTVIEHDKNDTFRYASLQSDFGMQLAKEVGVDTSKVDSIILVDETYDHWTKSCAAIHIAKDMKGAYTLLSVFFILPKFLRDPFYDFIAKNRYKWWGKQESCWLPTPELQAKFLG